MKKLVALLLVLLLAGCSSIGPRDGGVVSVQTPPQIPGRWKTTLEGVHVFLPNWLTDQKIILAVFAELATTAPAADPRIPVGSVGVPAGVKVYIQDPGSYSATDSPTGLARGHTDMRTFIVLAWRMQPWETRPYLPALRHELTHFYTKDPNVGH